MASPGGPAIPARYYGLFCDWLRAEGVDVGRLLAAAGITADELTRPEAELTLPQVESLVDHAKAFTGRPDLGFDWGRQIKLSSHDILGYALLSSPTLDYALRLTARFHRLMTPMFRQVYQRTAETASLEFTPAMSMSPELLRFHIEGVSVSAHDQLRMLLGGTIPPYDYYVSMPQPDYHPRYRELAPARWHFEAQAMPGIRVVLSASLADRTLEMADRNALRMAEARCEELLQRVTREIGLADWVTMMLREAQGGMPTREDLAHILHISVRTLERRLNAEGQPYLEIAKRVRLNKARELLAAGNQSVTQVALQLGYRDVANFTRVQARKRHEPERVSGKPAQGPLRVAQ